MQCYSAMYSVASFTADSITILLVDHHVSNIQDGDRNPEVQITLL